MAFKHLALGLLLQVSLGHAILLGGVEVPKEKMIVYLLIGHSNMAGIDTKLSDEVAQAKTWSYAWFKDKKWIPAKETRGNTLNGLSGRGEGGPGVPFVKAMATAYPDYNFGVVSTATVSCTLRGKNLGNNGSGFDADSNRYWKGAKLYNEIVAAAKEVQNQVTLAGVICMLGTVEATRTSDTVCNAFSEDAKQMVTDLRTDLGIPNLPFIIGEYEAGATGNFALTKPWPKIVDAQIKLIPSKLSLSATVNSVGIQMGVGDDHHYSANVGEPEFAKRVAEIIKAKGWVPPPSGSVLFVQRGKSNLKLGTGPLSITWNAKTGINLIQNKAELIRINGREFLLPSH